MPLSFSVGKKISKVNSPKNKKMFIKYAQKGEAHVQCMNNHYAKFEYLGIKTLGVTDNTNKNNLSISNEKMSKFKTPQK